MKATSIYSGFFVCLVLLLLQINPATAQLNGDTFIQKQFQSYTKKAIQEKVYLHTDRTFYLPGEMIWFKAYVVEGSTMQPLDLSKIAYLELIDGDNVPVVQTKFNLSKGKGNGSMLLPVSLGSGTYKIRSYTRWMQNFESDFFFESSIKIINPFVAFNPTPSEGSDSNYDVQFFPEGGHLIDNVESKIAYKAIDKNGRGVSLSGKIIDGEGREVSIITPEQLGMGSFTLRPKLGNEYKAIVTDHHGKSFHYPLPEIVKIGYAMQISDTTGARIQMQIFNQGMPSEGLWLVSHTRQEHFHSNKVIFEEGKAIVNIDKSQLGNGISHLTLMNEKGVPFCERLYFKYPSESLETSVSTSKTDFNQREKVVLDISAEVGNTSAANADFSVSVFLDDEIDRQDQVDINSYFWLTSDLRGTIESPETYFDKNNKNAASQMDLLMLTHGWRRLRWENVVTDQKSYHFLPEFHGHFIYSKVYDRLTGQPALDKQVFLASPDFPVRLYMGQTNNEGIARFEVKDFFGSKELTLQTDLSIDSTQQFELLNPFSSQFSKERRSARFYFDKSKEELLLNRSINMQTSNAFMPKDFLAGRIVYSDTMAFFGKPDEIYFLDDYTRFPTMEEVMREYVRGVFVRYRQKSFQFRMLDRLIPNMFYETNPLVLLDGIPIFDINKFMEFDPLKVKKIELLSGRHNLGNYSATGIVSVTTYYNDLAGYELDPKVHVQSYEGIQPIREFYSPKYDNPKALSSRVPDFRNLLYWAPEVKTDQNGKAQVHFYSSDQLGKYKVVLQGMTRQGVMGTQSYTFEVKSDNL